MTNRQPASLAAPPIARNRDGRDIRLGADGQLWCWGPGGQEVVANSGQVVEYLRKNARPKLSAGQLYWLANTEAAANERRSRRRKEAYLLRSDIRD